ncbi:amino acid ABC transporter substrate-binding protein [Zavarzinia aquatilis]|uniref:Amino acid ABC transporter substrate-bindnig protein n=1 Tax=Zavarzinia aquatilis TaxID=2211142 RepID=A0A317E834_9PROT|nr:amino acid ABC transporter substrate-binding protein [Zavarzinia aquatilis]PWR21493.1 amino acid ABC transporter substrate-bindnig protein [Zavarzinia aquatilis]
MNKLSQFTFGALLALGTVTAAQAGTLDDVKKKGFVQCGVSTGLAGFSAPDDKGEYKGLDVDVCKAVAAAVFGDATKVKFTPLTAKERFTALQSGEVDLLSRNTTWTLNRDTAQGLSFAGVTYYDGQGFMVRKSLGVKSAKELDGASICTETGTTTELNLSDYFKSNGLKYTVVALGSNSEAVAAYDSGRCDAYTTDASGLYATRIALAAPDDHMVLPEIISKEPLGPVVRQGDSQWFNVVKWSLFAMVAAEEYGVTAANVDEQKASSANPEVKRLLGAEGEFGTPMGLPNDWAYKIVKQLGNYGEAFDRNVGAGSPLKIDRGINALWNKGGLQYAPPFR